MRLSTLFAQLAVTYARVPSDIFGEWTADPDTNGCTLPSNEFSDCPITGNGYIGVALATTAPGALDRSGHVVVGALDNLTIHINTNSVWDVDGPVDKHHSWVTPAAARVAFGGTFVRRSDGKPFVDFRAQQQLGPGLLVVSYSIDSKSTGNKGLCPSPAKRHSH